MASTRTSAAAPDLARVLAHYRVGAPLPWQGVEPGYVNETWALDTVEGSYVLRRRHPRLRDPGTVAAQPALIADLREARFPAPEIVPTRVGDTFLRLEGEVYELQVRVSGQIREELGPSPDAATARTLARYHLAVAGFDHAALHRPRERYGPSGLTETVAGCAADWEGCLPAGALDLVARLRWHALLPVSARLWRRSPCSPSRTRGTAFSSR